MIRRALRRLRGEESGLSLVELLVSGLLTIAIMAMIGTMFIQTAKITTNSTQTTLSNNVAGNISNEITSVIRVATTVPTSGSILPLPAVVEGSREKLVLYSFSNTDPNTPAPVRVTFQVKVETRTTEPFKDVGRYVEEQRCVPVMSGGFWSYGSCTVTTQRLGWTVTDVTGTSNQLFTYYKSDGTPIVIGAGNLSAAQLSQVASIKVYVSIKGSNSYKTKETVISNLVVLGNLGLEDS